MISSNLDEHEKAPVNVIIRLRPVNNRERKEWRAGTLKRMMGEACIDQFYDKFRQTKGFKNPAKWHRWLHDTKKNNRVLKNDIGMQVGHIRQFRNFLRTFDVARLDDDNQDETLPFKIRKKDKQLRFMDNVGEEHVMTFDDILEHDVSQTEAFTRIAQETIEDVMHGVNGTIMAYGQSGTGKTFSLIGPEPLKRARPEEYGLLPMSVAVLFQSLREDGDVLKYDLKASFLEVYLEQLKDLMTGNHDNLKILEMEAGKFRLMQTQNKRARNLSQKEIGRLRRPQQAFKKEKKSGRQEVLVQNLSTHSFKKHKDFLGLINKASINRTKSSTNLNFSSSRSHMLITIFLNVEKKNGDKFHAKLNFVDLAGSEKVLKTGAVGKSLQEAKAINLSLTTLREVINALAQGKKYIPWRNSKLSMLVKDSLGGNSKTKMVICISPHKWNFEESVASLEFAKRARFIQNEVVTNFELSPEDLKKRLNEKDVEIARLQALLKNNQNPVGDQERQKIKMKVRNSILLSSRSSSEDNQGHVGEEIRAHKTPMKDGMSSVTETELQVHRNQGKKSAAQTEQKFDFAGMLPIGKLSSFDSVKLGSPVTKFGRTESYKNKKEETLMHMLIETQQQNKILEEDNQNLMLMNMDLEQRVADLEALANESMEMCNVMEARVLEMQELCQEPLKLKEEIKKLTDLLSEKERMLQSTKVLDRLPPPEDMLMRPSLGNLPGIGFSHNAALQLAETATEMESVASKLYNTADAKERRKHKSKKRDIAKVKRDRNNSISAMNFSPVNHLGVKSLDTKRADDQDTKFVKLMGRLALHFLKSERRNSSEMKQQVEKFTLSRWLDFIALQEFDLQSLPFVQIFGLIDDDSNGDMSESELLRFVKHFTELDNLKRGLGACFHPTAKWTLDTMLEHLEMHSMLRESKFEDIDKDNDGIISENDLSDYLSRRGGRPWQKGGTFSKYIIHWILVTISRNSDGRNSSITATNTDFSRYLDFNMITLNILGNAIKVDRDRWPFVSDSVTGLERIFKWKSTSFIDAAGVSRLKKKGVKQILERLRGPDSRSVKLNDRAIIYLEGLTLEQFKYVVQRCPIKIWQKIVDPDYDEKEDETLEEFMSSVKKEVETNPELSVSGLESLTLLGSYNKEISV